MSICLSRVPKGKSDHSTLWCKILQRLLLSLFPSGSDGKASAYHVGDLGSIPGSGRSPGEGSGNPLQYSCLENPMEGGTWWARVHGVAKSRTQLNDFTFFLSLSLFKWCPFKLYFQTTHSKVHSISLSADTMPILLKDESQTISTVPALHKYTYVYSTNK